MNTDRTYSVSQLSKLAGVSVRTLHHYDQKGLLKPNRGSNGYREYTQRHLILLQQIMVYRELDFSLDEILTILTSKNFDLLQALNNQRELLLKRLENTQSIIDSLEIAMDIVKGKSNLELLFKGLPTEKVERWKEMMTEGLDEKSDNEIYQLLSHLSEKDAQEEQERSDSWMNEYKLVLSLPVDSKKVQALIKEHYILTNRFFSKIQQDSSQFHGIGHKGYLHLADGVMSNKVSYEMYEHYAPGMAEHLYEAMYYFAEHSLKEYVEAFRKLGI